MKNYLDVIKEEVNLDRVQLSLKNLVFGIYKRNGIVITFSVSDRKHDTLIPLIKQYTKKGSFYYSDDHTAYAMLNMIGKHQIVAHGREEYVREDSHVNGLEGFWSYTKTWFYHYRGNSIFIYI